MERKRYPSDIAREQYESIRLLLESGKKTRPREVDLYEVFCTVLYVLKNACTWRSLPHDLPRWDRVCKYFQYCGGKPSEGQPSLLEQALKIVMPKRWVVEHSFTWLEKCRRPWKNCERKLNTSLQFVVLAFLQLLLKR